METISNSYDCDIAIFKLDGNVLRTISYQEG